MDKPADTPEDATASSAKQQTRQSILGEVTGYACGIGAVYVAEAMCPNQTRALIARLAESLGRWRGTSATVEAELARKVTDLAIMNVGGFVNMGTQFFWRRHQQSREERQPLPYELGRVMTGRIGGTITAFGTWALAETFAPRLMQAGQQRASKLMGDHACSGQLAERAMGNLVQSVGALAGNIPAQLLYDRLLGHDKAR